MDITTASEAVSPGSIPGGRTISAHPAFFLAALILLAGCGPRRAAGPGTAELERDLEALEKTLDAVAGRVDAVDQPVDETAEQRLARLGLDPGRLPPRPAAAGEVEKVLAGLAASGQDEAITEYFSRYCGCRPGTPSRSRRAETSYKGRLNARSVSLAGGALIATTYSVAPDRRYVTWVLVGDRQGRLLKAVREEGLTTGGSLRGDLAASDPRALHQWRGELERWAE